MQGSRADALRNRRMERDGAFITELEAQVQLFLHELDARLLALARLSPDLAEAA